MKIVNLLEFKQTNLLWEMWNEEFGFIFPISEELFRKNIYDYGSTVLTNSFVVLIEDNPIAFVIGKTWDNKWLIPSYDKCGWISLIYVKPHYRRQGIGSLLINKLEEIFVSQNKETIFLGKDYFNFFPGLPVDLKYYRTFFEKRGYLGNYDTNDLIKTITTTTNKEILKSFINDNNFIIKRAELNDLVELEFLIKNNWPGRWHVEFLDYVEKGGSGQEYMICLEDNKVVGFCKICDYETPSLLTSYSLNFKNRFNRIGGIGPLGVDINYRKRNIANNLIKICINELIDKGVTDIIIDWTNLMHIYNKYGFQIWKSYTYMQKDIK